MSTIGKLGGNDFDRMVLRGAFVDLEPMKVLEPKANFKENDEPNLRWVPPADSGKQYMPRRRRRKR